jgi:hypothetical protein
MLFIFSIPMLIKHLWQFKTAVFLHRCLLGVLFNKHFGGETFLSISVLADGGTDFNPSLIFQALQQTVDGVVHRRQSAHLRRNRGNLHHWNSLEVVGDIWYSIHNASFSSQLTNQPNKLECYITLG